MNKHISLQDVLATIQEWKIQASSPYNDGWVIQSYKDNLQQLKEHLEPRKDGT
jgi:hypothetical protein|tara:strand:+ start:350 stop:508 length:159 start_codon:yes stop_codon:yes gene_type:complete